MHQPPPVASEHITDTAEGDRPTHCSGEIEEQKARVRHPEEPGEDSRKDSQAGNETADEYRPLAVFHEKSLSSIKSPGQERQVLVVLFEKGRTPESPQAVTHTVPKGRPRDRRSDGAIEMDTSVVSEEPRKDQDGFAGNGQAGVFEHDAKEHCPISVALEEF